MSDTLKSEVRLLSHYWRKWKRWNEWVWRSETSFPVDLITPNDKQTLW